MPDLTDPKIFAEEMKKCFAQGKGTSLDIEARHSAADDLMCALLSKLGYEKAVQIYNNEEKWYA